MTPELAMVLATGYEPGGGDTFWTNRSASPIPDPHGNGVRIGEVDTPAQCNTFRRRLPPAITALGGWSVLWWRIEISLDMKIRAKLPQRTLGGGGNRRLL